MSKETMTVGRLLSLIIDVDPLLPVRIFTSAEQTETVQELFVSGCQGEAPEALVLKGTK